MEGRVRKRSVMVAGHRTSVSLEEAFWTALKEIADAKGASLNELITAVDEERDGNLSSALRLYVLRQLRGEAGGRGDRASGPG